MLEFVTELHDKQRSFQRLDQLRIGPRCGDEFGYLIIGQAGFNRVRFNLIEPFFCELAHGLTPVAARAASINELRAIGSIEVSVGLVLGRADWSLIFPDLMPRWTNCSASTSFALARAAATKGRTSSTR